MTVIMAIEIIAVEIKAVETISVKSSAANPLRASIDGQGHAGNDDRKRRLAY